MYAQFDEYASCFYIYPYDPNETAFKYSAPMFKLQELKSSI